jgi:hypothetical protein
MFPATTRTFTKDTALSEQGRARHGVCELTHSMAGERHGHGMAGERHGRGMLCVNPPLQSKKKKKKRYREEQYFSHREYQREHTRPAFFHDDGYIF